MIAQMSAGLDWGLHVEKLSHPVWSDLPKKKKKCYCGVGAIVIQHLFPDVEGACVAKV